MEYFLYSVEMPLSNVELFYRDINSKEQLILAKTNLLFPIEEENSKEYSRIVKKVIFNCVENKEDIYKLNIIDYFLFIIKLRINSFGETLELMLKGNENSNEMDSKISINLNVFMKNLYEKSKKAMEDCTITHKNLKICIDWPNMTSKEFFLKEKEEIGTAILSNIQEYIKNITINDVFIDTTTYKSEEKLELYEKLPISVKAKIQKKVLNAILAISKENLFDIKKMDFFKYNPYNKSQQQLMRFIFSDNLRNIYQEYYILSSKNINPLYIDSLSVSDRRVFCSFIKEESENSQKKSESTSKNNTPLEDLMHEFGE